MAEVSSLFSSPKATHPSHSTTHKHTHSLSSTYIYPAPIPSKSTVPHHTVPSSPLSPTHSPHSLPASHAELLRGKNGTRAGVGGSTLGFRNIKAQRAVQCRTGQRRVEQSKGSNIAMVREGNMTRHRHGQRERQKRRRREKKTPIHPYRSIN